MVFVVHVSIFRLKHVTKLLKKVPRHELNLSRNIDNNINNKNKYYIFFIILNMQGLDFWG